MPKRKNTTPAMNKSVGASYNDDDYHNSDCENLNGIAGALGDNYSSIPDFSNEMNTLLKHFKSNVSKTILMKKRKLEEFTEKSVRTTSKNILSSMKKHSAERQKVSAQFKQRFASCVDKGEVEMRRPEYEIVHPKNHQLMKETQVRRLQQLKSIGEELLKNLGDLEASHSKEHLMMHDKLGRELMLLQKNVVMNDKH